jgi:dienelactone hydrolase
VFYKRLIALVIALVIPVGEELQASRGPLELDKAPWSVFTFDKRQVLEDGLNGTLFSPVGKNKAPGLLVIHGSAGIIPESMAMYLAAHGYIALALGYFGVEGAPAGLAEIKLEYFQQAIIYLKNQPQVKKESIGIIGVSRGGEAALLVASTFPQDISVVITFVPCSYVNGGSPHSNWPAWVYENKPIAPFMPGLEQDQTNIMFLQDVKKAEKDGLIPFHAGTEDDPIKPILLSHERIRKYELMLETAAIPVENLRSPLLLLSGEDDQLWPSTYFCDRIMERLQSKGSQIIREHVQFSNAGHVFFTLPDQSAAINHKGYHRFHDCWLTYGGTPDGNARASRESWAHILRFLKQHLK